MKRRASFAILIAALCACVAFAQIKKSAPPAPALSAEAGRGKGLYAKHCEICHYSQTEELKMAPGLKAIYKKGKYTDGKKVDDASMRAWIEKGGPKMPPLRETLNVQQISDLIAYIRTL